jgi:hypothetical protein
MQFKTRTQLASKTIGLNTVGVVIEVKAISAGRGIGQQAAAWNFGNGSVARWKMTRVQECRSHHTDMCNGSVYVFCHVCKNGSKL